MNDLSAPLPQRGHSRSGPSPRITRCHSSGRPPSPRPAAALLDRAAKSTGGVPNSSRSPLALDHPERTRVRVAAKAGGVDSVGDPQHLLRRPAPTARAAIFSARVDRVCWARSTGWQLSAAARSYARGIGGRGFERCLVLVERRPRVCTSGGSPKAFGEHRMRHRHINPAPVIGADEIIRPQRIGQFYQPVRRCGAGPWSEGNPAGRSLHTPERIYKARAPHSIRARPK